MEKACTMGIQKDMVTNAASLFLSKYGRKVQQVVGNGNCSIVCHSYFLEFKIDIPMFELPWLISLTTIPLLHQLLPTVDYFRPCEENEEQLCVGKPS